MNRYENTKKPIKIDFEGVRMISSSFADEFIGKIVVRYGIVDFSRMITMLNMDETITQIINKAVEKRMIGGFDETAAEA